ncbi:ADP-ribosylglycohydrolase family protein [Marinobacterium sediminicola]|uniref:ADP-ribosylglycohydrolase n=1 Tax=Marinobacterium sediminicola TaxID=518898 RepID=A0ABY1RWA9_9GAMM|nr:ADP-ribosylglycohydrolase family protein [Marinobacterium sediminicola]ULG70370.1 ADP-ribosylglycohydrolase family protein [Marinobacterium sediminicola]SMR69587.1 ADP-ribosylglycohydrolase [Marinobacterium sediminicola]
MQDKLTGMLAGLAIGDAMGASVEFMPPGSFDLLTGFRDGGPHDLPAGYWTDDTSMALCTAYSLLDCRGFDPHDQMQRFVRWFREGYCSSTGRCFDIGHRTRSALLRYERTADPFAGEESLDQAGNGTLMRLAPIVIHAWQRPDLLRLASEHGRLTHADPRCLDANKAFALMLKAAITAHSLADVWQSPLLTELLPELDAEVIGVCLGSFLEREPPAIRATGYVIDSLEAALWAFSHSDSFEQGMLKAVNLGEDADTVGAIYGQLAGAYYGLEAIPSEWRRQLYGYQTLVALAQQLVSD